MEIQEIGRVIGIDYGDSRIGLALSDPMQIIAKPSGIIHNKGEDYVLNELKSIIAENRVEKIVVGMPFGMKGNDTVQTKKVRGFIDFLEQNFDMQIISVDERLSTKSAISSLVQQKIDTGREKHRVDETAAAIILQEFLDSK